MHLISDGVLAQIREPAVAAALAAVALVGLVLAFIFLRRLIRRRYFRRHDARVQFVRQNWDRIASGEIPYESWLSKRMDRQVVEELALARLEAGEGDEVRKLQRLFRASGLLDRLIREAGQRRGWRRRRALLTLGRVEARECLPILMEALEDPHEAVVVDAIRAIGRIGDPKAGVTVLERLSRKAAPCPANILQSALAGCFREHSSELLELARHAPDSLRPLMVQVLAEVASPDTSGDLLALAADPLAEVRAAAARILALVQPSYLSTALAELARDPVWFVRLRAMLAIGKWRNRYALPLLIRGLCDANRLVRLRAASALAAVDGEELEILRLVTQTADRYALQALVSEMERSGKIIRLVDTLAGASSNPRAAPALLAAVRGGAVRMMADLVLHHPNLRVREMLAKILAQSQDPALLAHLGQLYPKSPAEEQPALRRLAAALGGKHQAAVRPESVWAP